jgi:hypothetical protein
VASSPESEQLNAPRDSEVRITFSEKIRADFTPAQVFITPAPEKAPRLSRDKNDLVIKFQDSLRPDQTYLVTIQTGLSDLRGNKLKRPLKLAFSTGDKLERGTIAGLILADYRPLSGVEIWAFRAMPDFNLFSAAPEYLIQSDDSGRYKLEYLAEGEYLCFAVSDKNGDRKYEPEQDLLGMPVGPISLDSSHILAEGCNFAIRRFDTSALKITAADYTEDLLLSLKFSAKLYTPALAPDDFSIFSLDSGRQYQVLGIVAFADTADRILLWPERALPLGKGILLAARLHDLFGNPVDSSSDSLTFAVSREADTNPPRLVRSYPEDEERRFPPDQPLRLYFSEPVSLDSMYGDIVTLFQADSALPGNLTIKQSDHLTTIFPPDSLLGGREYILKIDLAGIVDRFGNRGGDSLMQIKFVAEDRSEYGAISGQIAAPVLAAYPALRICILNVERTLPQPCGFDQNGRFYLQVPAGRYFFYGFDDRNGNDTYDFGSVRPFGLAESFFIFRDTVSVRARFESEDVQLIPLQ